MEPVVIKITSDSYSWVPEVQKSLTSLNTDREQKLVLYAEKEKYNGLLGFFNCIRKEAQGEHVRYGISVFTETAGEVGISITGRLN